MSRPSGFLALTFLAASACSRAPAPAPAPQEAVTKETKEVAATAKAPMDGGTTGAAKPSAGPRKWTGSYKTTAGSLYVPQGTDVPNPQEWAGTKWHGDDAGTALGDGTLTLTIDGSTGRVEGTAEGALGPLSVAGLLTGDHLALSMTRKDPSDKGAVGTAWGTLSGDRIEGAMRLSSLQLANVLREGTFALTRQP